MNFEKNVVNFIKEQAEKIEDEKILKKLEKLENKKYKELMKIAREDNAKGFRLLDGSIFSNCVPYLDSEEKSDITCDLIAFIMNMDCSVDCDNNLFYYIRNCIIETSDNPIKTAVMISIH